MYVCMVRWYVVNTYVMMGTVSPEDWGTPVVGILPEFGKRA